MGTATEAQRLKRKNEEESRIEAQIASLKKRADLSEIVTAFVDTPAWQEVLLPQLTEDLRRFQEIDSWHAPVVGEAGESFLEKRAAAFRSRRIREYFLTNVGKRDHYLDEARAMALKLEAFRKSQGDG